MAKLTLPVGDRDHAQGPAAASVTLVEYGDYECPHCGAAYPVVKKLQKKLGMSLRFVFRNFPLNNMHPHAEHAAEAAETAAAQGKFWEMHDWIFEHQDSLEDGDLLQAAESLRLDAKLFLKEMQSGAHLARVKEDFMSGMRSGVNGTPTFFINGVRHNGAPSYEDLLAALTEAVAQP
ncbi:MAG TPA: thioredoxin domain-containing protein [Planctomycetota bacterium]|jgi:protein-disulfide isomerase|nr:thioredoxin domain-containing protein [Planctomycetota bacterium]